MKKNGFTLVELLAVLVIISLLLVMALTNVFGLFSSSKIAINNIQLNSLKDGLKLYAQEMNIDNCNTSCTGNDALFDICLANEAACKANSQTSLTTTLNSLISNKYFEDKGDSCSPKTGSVKVYKMNGNFYYDLTAITCIK